MKKSHNKNGVILKIFSRKATNKERSPSYKKKIGLQKNYISQVVEEEDLDSDNSQFAFLATVERDNGENINEQGSSHDEEEEIRDKKTLIRDIRTMEEDMTKAIDEINKMGDKLKSLRSKIK